MTSGDAARRSAARERRRAAASDQNGRDEADTRLSGGGLESAARAAAAAAAVGAALGAVKALAQRDDESGDRDDVLDRSESEGRVQSAVADEPAHEDEDESRDEATVGANGDEPDAAHAEPGAQQQGPRENESNDGERRSREGAAAGTVRSIAARAREQLRELQGRDAESITALERTRDGWRVTCEVLEVERIPNSTDVLATYVVELDGDGELLAFERVRRYYRAQAGGEQ